MTTSKPTIALKNAEAALAITRARVLTQLALAKRFGRHDAAGNLRTILIVLDHSLDAGPTRTRVLAESSTLYRSVQHRSNAGRRAAHNRQADRSAA